MITLPQKDRLVVDGKASIELYQMLFLLSKVPPIVGTGSPEGVVEATQTQLYMDDAGVAGAILYIKRDADVGGDRSQGWILV